MKCVLPFLNVLLHQLKVVVLGRVGHPFIAKLVGIQVVLMTNLLDCIEEQRGGEREAGKGGERERVRERERKREREREREREIRCKDV